MMISIRYRYRYHFDIVTILSFRHRILIILTSNLHCNDIESSSNAHRHRYDEVTFNLTMSNRCRYDQSDVDTISIRHRCDLWGFCKVTLAFQGDIEDSEGDFTYYLSTILTLTEVFTNEKDPVDLYIQVKQRAIERLRKGNPDLTTTEFFETLKAKTPRGKGKAPSTTPIITSPVLKNLEDNPWETPQGSPSIRPISPLKNLGFPLHIQPTLSGVSTPNWSNPPTRSPTPEKSNSNSNTSLSDSETVSETETEEEKNMSPRHLRHIIGSRIPTLADITTMAEKMIVKPSKYYG